MLVRFESTPMTASPLELLVDRSTIFPDFFRHGVDTRREGYPYVNIADIDDTIHVVAEVPGVPKDDIKIHLQNDLLTISGERKQPALKAEGVWTRQEIMYGEFERTFKLPYDVDATKVSAEYADGVLRVQLPKTEASKPKTIVIQ